MNFVSLDRATRLRELNNMLSTMSNVLWAMQHKPEGWDMAMKALQNMSITIPLALRYCIYLKNTEGKPDVPGLSGPN